MCSPTDLRPKRVEHCAFHIREVQVNNGQFNRMLYNLVGGPWSWLDKAAWSEREWKEYAENEMLRTWGAYDNDSPAGYYELRKDDKGDVEIAYFGLIPKYIGCGYGGALLTNAIEEAWRWGARRVWVHTCNFDHPAAVANYQARGMRIYHVETKSK